MSILSNNKNKYDSLIISTKQLIVSQKNGIKSYRMSNGKRPNRITKILETRLIDSGIKRARYHGGNLDQTSIVRLFQNTDNFKKKTIERN